MNEHAAISSGTGQKKPTLIDPAASSWGPLVVSILVCLGATAISELIFPTLEPANLIMIYLLGVAWLASRFSYREALLGSIVSVALFDFFFVPPRFTFVVNDGQYLITFAVMLTVSILISRLTQKLKRQAQATSEQERQTNALFALGQDLLRVRTIKEIDEVANLHIARALGFNSAIIQDEHKSDEGSNPDSRAAAWVLKHNQPAGNGTAAMRDLAALYLPLGTAEASRAVLRVSPQSSDQLTPSARKLLNAYAAQVSLGLERLLLEDHAQAARLSAEREQLKNLLLSSISHDLRTPLTVISGASAILLESPALAKERQEELLSSIRHQSERLSTVVRNVLDLTKLEAGQVKLNLDWYSLEELIGAALNAARPSLGQRVVKAHVPHELPLIRVDGILFEQVLVNLFENIGKHTPPGSTVSLNAGSRDDRIILQIEDDGPGFEENTEGRVFDKLFTGRGRDAAGMGLGLTICRAIVESHHGAIDAQNRTDGGARIEISLPIEKGDRRGD